jgi:hypothetical protein
MAILKETHHLFFLKSWELTLVAVQCFQHCSAGCDVTASNGNVTVSHLVSIYQLRNSRGRGFFFFCVCIVNNTPLRGRNLVHNWKISPDFNMAKGTKGLQKGYLVTQKE